MSSYVPTYHIPSPAAQIRDGLREMKHDKWGWIIYRCTYSDDSAWVRFRHIIEENSRRAIAESDAPEIADSLQWTFVEDRATLDSASRESLRARFRAWATAPETISSEQPRAEDISSFALAGVPRYHYFIQVDEEALRSVADDPQGHGHVNFVYADWEPLSAVVPGYENSEEAAEDMHEPIDGCRDEDVGWMKISSHMIGPDFYDIMSGLPDVWHACYRRPPAIVHV
ncbi:hypothetical protein F4774DRAFT_411868 [Daldinia eschscholtzii]|nr:hypothetical protein F4774DRAFT_411868 [Daldinia eschscholtzii]